MQQPKLSPIILKFSLTNQYGDKISTIKHVINDGDLSTETQIAQTLSTITESVNTWLTTGQMEFAANALTQEDDGNYVVSFKDQLITIPTQHFVFRATLPQVREGILKGAHEVTIQKES
jgi:hypothetical protein